MTITSIFASLLALMYVVLSVRVIGARRRAQVALGDGGDPHLLRCQRVHANFSEYVPLTLILMLVAEHQGAWSGAVLLIGGLLLVGRIIHAYGVSQSPEKLWQRVSGMVLTFSALALGAFVNLAQAFIAS
jgi:uncharacterized membrane protein YecN with MAPEG domain